MAITSFYSAPPKLWFGDPKWRETLKAGMFSRKHHLIVVDEAHTVLQWLVLALFVFFIIVWLIIINQLVRELIKYLQLPLYILLIAEPHLFRKLR